MRTITEKPDIMTSPDNKKDVYVLLKKKLARLRNGGKIRTLDLFAGCGGIALGFHAAGFHTMGSVEIDNFAAASFASNFADDAPDVDAERLAEARDITALDPADVLSYLGCKTPTEDTVDVIVGGPPCQAFARVGRAKLREVDDHPQAFKLDPRGNLYLRYLAYIRETRPLAILMENVPDVLNYGGHNISEEVCEVLEQEGYHCQYSLLNSAYYGVPQTRERMFLVAVHEIAAGAFSFPKPTHSVDLPAGYEGTRAVALKFIRGRDKDFNQCDLGFENSHFISPPTPDPDLPKAITAEQATSDLPQLFAQKLLDSGELKRGAKRFTERMPYAKRRPSGYARLMREWPGFEARDGVYDHVIRYLPRDFKLFAKMKPGDQYPQVHALATAMFERELKRRRAKGDQIPDGSPEYEELQAEYVPPYDPGKFPNKWRKMEADKPARTLLAHLGKDSYTHIHYDSKQGRTISVREGARLQSFPDGFAFEGTINPAFRQIGNAVPPLMAYAIARQIREALGLTQLVDIRAGRIL